MVLKSNKHGAKKEVSVEMVLIESNKNGTKKEVSVEMVLLESNEKAADQRYVHWIIGIFTVSQTKKIT